MTLPLFDVGDQPTVEPPPKPKPDARRRERQAACLARGQHPLAAALRYPLPLHVEAAPIDDRDAPGRRCGNCEFREQVRWHNSTYAKCSYDDWSMATHGPGTDARAWWPGCRHHEPKVAKQ